MQILIVNQDEVRAPVAHGGVHRRHGDGPGRARAGRGAAAAAAGRCAARAARARSAPCPPTSPRRPPSGSRSSPSSPATTAPSYDSHQGAVLLFETEHGRLLAIMDASSITAIRTAAVSGVATRALAREDAGDLALLGSGVQAATHLEAMRARAAAAPGARLEPRSPRTSRAFVDGGAGAPRLRGRGRAERARRGRGRGRRLHASPPRASRCCEGAGCAPGAHVNAVGASLPHARASSTPRRSARARLFVDRRESALERGRRLAHPAARRRHRRRPHRGRAGRGAARPRATGRRVGRRDHALQVARPRRRGRRLRAPHPRARAGARGGDVGRARRRARCRA